MSKWLKVCMLSVIIFALAIPAVGYAAVDKKQEVEDYFTALQSIADYESKALDAFYDNQFFTSATRKESYKAYAYTIVPNYQKFVLGIKAIKAPATPELLKLHKAGLSATYQQLSALNIIKNALYKNPMDSASIDKANKILKTAAPAVQQWGKDLAAYYTKVMEEAALEEGTETETDIPSDIEQPAAGSTAIPSFGSDATGAQMFEAIKPAASYLLQVYADALKSGNDDKMDAWLKANIGTSEYGNNFADKSLENFNRNLDSYHDIYEPSQITSIANSAINKAKASKFTEDSEYDDYGSTYMFTYYVDVNNGDYNSQIGIYFHVWLNEDTNTYYLSSISFY